MTQETQKLFDTFIIYYNKGQFKEAFQTLINSPLVDYDKINSSNNPFFALILDYVDACIFKGAVDYFRLSQSLINFLKQEEELSEEKSFFKQNLEQDFRIFSLSRTEIKESQVVTDETKKIKEFFELIKQKEILEEEIDLSFIPQEHQAFFQQKINLLHNWQILKKEKRDFSLLLESNELQLKQPWHLFAYPLPVVWKELNKTGEIPLIFLETLEGCDYAEVLRAYSQNPAILVIETVAHFFHLLQFPSFQEILKQPSFILYILELYPQQQFASQNYYWKEAHTFRPLLMTKRADIEEMIPVFEKALGACLLQEKEAWEQDTLVANGLYFLANKIINQREAERYGISRIIPFRIETGIKRWYDLHKGPLPLDAETGPSIPDKFNSLLLELLQKREPRKYAPKKRINLAHVVTQLVDESHAPTRLLKQLCTFADLNWFNVYVISTERLTVRPLDYPSFSHVAYSSIFSGQQTYQDLTRLGIRVLFDPLSPSSEAAAQSTTKILKDLNIDIAVFHGPDEINMWCSCATDVPFRIFFEHGTLPSYPYFDLAILDSQEAYNRNHERFRKQKMESCVLPFSVNVKQGWSQEIDSKESLGLPKESFVMTTISNHLDNRLSLGMCQAIGEILQRCPQAVYAPIGVIKNPERLRALWEPYHVNDRIFFLGHVTNPGQKVRAMQLYLNEFPFGSGVSLLEALASGCPIVSFFNPEGAQQGYHAATYFGLDYLIHSGKKEDYVDLACRLIEEPDFYQQWSQHAQEQYEKYADAQAYAKKFEKILDTFIEYSLKSSNKN